MSDLISRQAVIDIIDRFGYVNCHDGRDYETNNRVDKVRQSVTELLTAYDVDKVVEQLEEFRDELHQFNIGWILTDIIEIVKAGGLNEWH